MAQLREDELELLRSARRAVLATTDSDGRPRLVPIAYAFADLGGRVVLYSALDEKPKSVSDPRHLARVRDIVRQPGATVLVDRWNEDWAQLAWLRLDGTATLLEPGSDEHPRAIGLLRARYPQYAAQRLEHRPMIRIEMVRAIGWRADR